jgi:tetratricopeptide (TPR) repeat protein
MKPDYAPAYYYRGLAKKKLNDTNGEIQDYTKAIEFRPDFEKAYYERGMARYASGDKTGGCEDLNKAVRLGSDDAYNNLVIHCK